jgi:hypothetical protein
MMHAAVFVFEVAAHKNGEDAITVLIVVAPLSKTRP